MYDFTVRKVKHVFVYSAILTLAVIVYVRWSKRSPPPRGVLGTHAKQPLGKEKLLQLTREIRDSYVNEKTEESFNYHCSDCALVISSGQLLDKNAGTEIDRASCVIRMNDAPVVGHTRDVGRKTTLRVVCFKSLRFLKDSMLIGRGKTDMVAVWGVKNPDHRTGDEYYLKQVMDTYRHSPIQFYSMENEGETKVVEIYESELGISRVATNSWVSTGVFAMMLAIQMCRNITVYGLVDESYCRLHGDAAVPYHYYGRSMVECEMYKKNEDERKDGSHRFITEKTLFRRWASVLDINFRFPSWNLTAST